MFPELSGGARVLMRQICWIFWVHRGDECQALSKFNWLCSISTFRNQPVHTDWNIPSSRQDYGVDASILLLADNYQICFKFSLQPLVNVVSVCHAIWDCLLCMHRDHQISGSVKLKTRFQTIDSTTVQPLWSSC